MFVSNTANNRRTARHTLKTTHLVPLQAGQQNFRGFLRSPQSLQHFSPQSPRASDSVISLKNVADDLLCIEKLLRAVVLHCEQRIQRRVLVVSHLLHVLELRVTPTSQKYDLSSRADKRSSLQKLRIDELRRVELRFVE